MKKVLLVLILLFALSMIFCACSVPIASAEGTLPDSGIVGDNLCLFNDLTMLSANFTSLGSSSYIVPWSDDSNTQNIRVGYVLGFNISNNILSRDSQGGLWGTFAYRFINLPIGTYTMTYKVSNLVGTVRATVQGFSSSNFSSSGLASISFTTTSIAQRDLQIQLQSNSSCTLEYVKLEQGSAFTGYVPNSYTNYGYNQGKSDGVTAGRESVYNTNNGWSKYSVFKDYKSSDQYLSDITSSNGGTVNYASNRGMQLTSLANGTSFLVNLNYYGFSSSNSIATLAVGYSGNFVKGDVVLTFDYSYYTAETPTFPPSGAEPVTTTYSYSLDPGKIFIHTIDPIGFYPSRFTLTLKNGVEFYLVAFKIESGSTFTLFPIGGSDKSSFANGYNSGYVDGLDKGLSFGYDDGYAVGSSDGFASGQAQGYSEGRTAGYSAGLQTAQNGSFFALFSSLIDVPVSALISLLDFQFFGINMWNFARFLLTLSLFIAVLHVFTKGKLKV